MNYVDRISSSVLPTRKSQKGFTLIELVIVIVILAILAAFAIPRFIDLAGNARTSAVQGLEGGMRSAAALAHSAQIAGSLAPGASVTMSGQVVTMINGYPTANAAGIGAALESTVNFATTGGGAAAGDAIVYSYTGTAAGNCQVTYTASAAVNASPVITPVTANC